MMKRMRRVLAIILTASMLLGNTGIAYATESAGASATEAVVEDQSSSSGSGEQAAVVEEEKFTAGELRYEGASYTVTMAYDENAKIPAGATLKVREISKGSSEYEAYLAGAEAASDKSVAEARFFDITIWADGKEVQPQSAVRVNISYNKAIEVADEGEVQAICTSFLGSDG